MPLYILDTDHVTLLQRGHGQVQQRVLALPHEVVNTTMVTVEEQLRGRLKAIRRASDGPALVAAYDRMHGTLEFFQGIPLLRFDKLAHEWFRHFREKKIRVGTHDLRIAAITLAANAILVTRNARDFSQVAGLELQDWSSR